MLRFLGCFSVYFLGAMIISKVVDNLTKPFELSQNSISLLFLALLTLTFYFIYRYGKKVNEKKIEQQEIKKRARLECFSVSHFTEEGYYPILELRPIKILAKFKRRPRREVLTVRGILLDVQGYPVFDLQDEFGRAFFGHYFDLTSLITYGKETYRTFDDFLDACATKKEIKAYKQVKNDFIEFVANLKN